MDPAQAQGHLQCATENPVNWSWGETEVIMLNPSFYSWKIEKEDTTCQEHTGLCVVGKHLRRCRDYSQLNPDIPELEARLHYLASEVTQTL